MHNAEVGALFRGKGGGEGDIVSVKHFPWAKKREDLQKTELLELKIAMAYILKHASLPRFM